MRIEFLRAAKFAHPRKKGEYVHYKIGVHDVPEFVLKDKYFGLLLKDKMVLEAKDKPTVAQDQHQRHKTLISTLAKSNKQEPHPQEADLDDADLVDASADDVDSDDVDADEVEGEEPLDEDGVSELLDGAEKPKASKKKKKSRR